MTVDEVLKKILDLGEPTDAARLYVSLALAWPTLQKIPEETRVLAAALFALHLRDTRHQSGQIVTEREGDLSRTYATTKSDDPLGLSFWGRLLKDLIPDVSAASDLHQPSILVSSYGKGDWCGCH